MKKYILVVGIMVIVLVSSIAFAAEAVEKSMVINDGEEIILHIPSCRIGEDFFSVNLLLQDDQDDIFFEIINISEIDLLQQFFRRLETNAAAVWSQQEEKLIVHSVGLTDEKGDIIYYEMSFRFVIGSNLLQLTDWMHENLKFYGPAFTAVDGIGDEDGYIQEVSSFSNLAMIGSEFALDDIDKIEEAANYGMQSIVVVCDIFFEFIWDDETGQLVDVVLRSDHMERWLENVGELQSVKDKIKGFFLFDEMYWVALQCGISFKKMREMMEEAASIIKAQFPDKKVIGSIAITEGDLEQEYLYGFPIPANALKEYGIPENWDWIAIYNYWAQREMGTGIDQFLETWDKRMQSFKKHMHPWQDIVLVPGTFYFSFQDSMETDLVELVDFYWGLAKTDPRIVAIVPFLWPSVDCLVGLEEMPTLRRRWSKIGKRIINRGDLK